MFKLKRSFSKFASLIVAAALLVPLFISAGAASASVISSAAAGLASAAAPAAAAVPDGTKTVSAIILSSSVTSVKAGELQPFTVTTTTSKAHVEAYGSTTRWLRWTTADGKWSGFGYDTPYAQNDGSTRYGLQVRVKLEAGNAFSSNPTIYYNGTNITSGTYTEYRKNDDRSAIITIDLGKATGSSSPSWRTVTFDSNGGTEIKASKIVNGYTAAKPLNPTKGDLVFWGWYSDPGLTQKFDFDTPITKNTTLYARWETYSKYIYDVDICGDVVTLNPGKLPSCNFTSETEDVHILPNNSGYTWIQWSGYGGNCDHG